MTLLSIICALVITIVWVLLDGTGWYDPHTSRSVLFRWFVFLVTTGVIANLINWAGPPDATGELWLIMIFARGAAFDPFWNITNNHGWFYHKLDDKKTIKVFGKQIKIDTIDHPAYPLISLVITALIIIL